MTNLDIIKQLEQEIGKKLDQISLDEIDDLNYGYVIDENKNIVGLNLNSNNLNVFPNVITKLINLRKLSLHDNEIAKLPDSFGQLQNLSDLDLSSNKLSKLPASFGQLQNLRKLNLWDNKLSKLPASFGQLQNLSDLDLSSNKLSKLPTSFGQLQNLINLDLSSNKLSELPASFGQLQNLSNLDLSHNLLSELPASLGQLQNLSELGLYDNQLSELPAWLGQMQNLSALFLNNNQLSELPAWLGQMQNLSDLGLGSNQLLELPTWLGQLQNLSHLYLEENQLSELPAWFGQLQNLSVLSLHDNQLSELPAWFGQLQNLSELDLYDNQLSELPASFGQLQNLKKLNLWDNKLSKLPASFGQLQNLSLLWLWKNQLSELPASFGQLQKLSSLNLSYNQLSELPASFGQLQNLSDLDLGSNQLSELPASFGQLQNLSELHLDNNQLSELPASFGQLQNLSELHLDNNQLSELPASFGQLLNLQKLYLYSNKISQLPKEILHFNLDIIWTTGYIRKCIVVGNNPFETPPIEIIKQGKEAIANYYAALEQQPRPLNESKLILIGDGGAGKTSLMKRLLGQDFNPQESQTHGININTLGFKHQDQDIKLHCWDFGGQQIMHATHQFFLSKRSLYVLVLDSRRETQADYWLKHIQTFGNNAPVIIAINKIDENPHFSLPKRKLLQQYPNIKYIARISCATQDGIDDLKNQIQNRLADIELLHTLFPATWFRVKTTIVEQAAQTNFASYEQFVDLCEKNGIQKESEQNTLINFLHDLGIVIHFQDRWLRETNVINPQWITEAIYSIINASQLVGGKLYREQLTHILDNTIYPTRKHDYIIELMKKFELCYALNDDEFLLPDLFNNEEPEFDFDDNHALHIIFDYDFLPSSIFTRFIVRMHKDIHNNIYWRKGCLLHNANYHSSALIETNNNQITLQINGQQAREYLTVLQFILNDLNNRFNNLKIITKIGLPDAPQTTVNQDYLLQLVNKGQTVYTPPEMPDKSYNIADLLGTVYNENLNEHQIMHMFQTIMTILQDMGLKQEELLEKGDELLRDKGRKDIVEIKPGIGGVSVDLKEIWRRMVNK